MSRIAGQCVDQQVRPQSGTANSDVQYVPNFPKGFGFDHIDQHAHTMLQHLGVIDAVGCAIAAFGHMFGGALFAGVDNIPRK
jgi:hypothetical protein